jgi:hypothetical protein
LFSSSWAYSTSTGRKNTEHVEDEAEHRAGHGAEASGFLRAANPRECAVPRDEGRHDHDPADRDGKQRDERTDVHAGRIPKLTIDLVVPDEVVDPEGDERPDEDQEGVPDLHRRAADVNRLSHPTKRNLKR